MLVGLAARKAHGSPPVIFAVQLDFNSEMYLIQPVDLIGRL